MAMGIQQRLRGIVDKARAYWADLTDETAHRSQADQEELEDAVHQRYGGVRTKGERDIAAMKRDRDENSMDRGPSDALMANPAARAGRTEQLGSQRRSQQQMQDNQTTQRQYAQQGGSGSQKTLGEQMGGQMGSEAGSRRSYRQDQDEDEQQRPRSPGRLGREE